MDARFRQLQYLSSVHDRAALPNDDLPEVAIAGRSNVGKSSLLNALAGNSKLARVSRQPGRTQAVNLFSLGEDARLLDLPGYGYAKVAKSMRKEWGALIEAALARPNLRVLVALMDIRHPLTDNDKQLLAFATSLECAVLPVLTKADKLSRGAGLRVRDQVAGKLGGVEVLLTSSQKKDGVEALQTRIIELLGTPP